MKGKIAELWQSSYLIIPLKLYVVTMRVRATRAPQSGSENNFELVGVFTWYILRNYRPVIAMYGQQPHERPFVLRIPVCSAIPSTLPLPRPRPRLLGAESPLVAWSTRGCYLRAR